MKLINIMIVAIILSGIINVANAENLKYEQHVLFVQYTQDVVRFPNFMVENVIVTNIDSKEGYFSVKVDGITQKNSGFKNINLQPGSSHEFQISIFQKSSFPNYEKDFPAKYHVIASTSQISEQAFIDSSPIVEQPTASYPPNYTISCSGNPVGCQIPPQPTLTPVIGDAVEIFLGNHLKEANNSGYDANGNFTGKGAVRIGLFGEAFIAYEGGKYVWNKLKRFW